MSCPADDVGFGGARGGGKSDAIPGDFAAHEEQYGEHAIGVAFRRERTQLIELIERSRAILSPIGFRWHEQDKYFRGPKGGRLRFAYLERDSDADAYQGHGYTRLYVEEMGTFPDEKPINKLFATLRSGHGVPCQMKGTTNPGGAGHNWVKARYGIAGKINQVICQEFEFENPWTKKKITKTRVFIPSRLQDNKYLGDDYVANIAQSGSPALVKAWLEGDWDVVEGAFFDSWSAAKHVIPPFAIPPDWLRFRSGDWGFAAPFSFGWWAVVGDDFHVANVHLRRGALVRYREWYGAATPNVGIRRNADDVAHEIVRKEAGEKISYGVLDPSTFKNEGGPPIAETFNKVLIANKLAPFRPADNKRVPDRGAMGGWDQMRARLNGIDGFPMLFVFSTCTDFIRTVPALQHDPDKPEDLDTEGEDHAADEARYACMSRPWVPKKIEEKPDKSELKLWVNEQGRVQANMSVMEIVQQRMRRKKANGY